MDPKAWKKRRYLLNYKRQYWLAYVEKITLALTIHLILLQNNRVINILPNLQAYFAKRRYFPILMFTFALILHMSPKSNMWTGIMLTLAHHSVAKTNSICEYIYYTTHTY